MNAIDRKLQQHLNYLNGRPRPARFRFSYNTVLLFIWK